MSAVHLYVPLTHPRKLASKCDVSNLDKRKGEEFRGKGNYTQLHKE